MSTAWEVTAEDIATVLKCHGLPSDAARADELLSECFVNDDRVVEAVLYYCDFDQQVVAALSEIEDVLTEAGHLPGGVKLFPSPEEKI